MKEHETKSVDYRFALLCSWIDTFGHHNGHALNRLRAIPSGLQLPHLGLQVAHLQLELATVGALRSREARRGAERPQEAREPLRSSRVDAVAEPTRLLADAAEDARG